MNLTKTQGTQTFAKTRKMLVQQKGNQIPRVNHKQRFNNNG